jgi:hypothetical protein
MFFTVYPTTEARRQKTEWFVAFGEIICCLVGLVLFSLLVVAIRPCGFIRKLHLTRCYSVVLVLVLTLCDIGQLNWL